MNAHQQLRGRIHPPRGPLAPNPDDLVAGLFGVILALSLAIGVMSALGVA